MRRTIRLTESELRQMISESVKKLMNEVADTVPGQKMVGRLHGRKQKQGNIDKANEIEKYAKKKSKKPMKGGFTTNSDMDSAFEKGSREEYFKESRLSKIIENSIRKTLDEVNFGGESLHGNNPEDWEMLGQIRADREKEAEKKWSGTINKDKPLGDNDLWFNAHKNGNAKGQNFNNSARLYNQQNGSSKGFSDMTNRASKRVNALRQRGIG